MIISVPEAWKLPIKPYPISFEILSTNSTGKPSGNTAKSFLVISPAISQCPVVESLPRDASASFPTIEKPFWLFKPSISVIAPKPSFSNVGSYNPPFALETLPNVLEPLSP